MGLVESDDSGLGVGEGGGSDGGGVVLGGGVLFGGVLDGEGSVREVGVRDGLGDVLLEGVLDAGSLGTAVVGVAVTDDDDVLGVGESCWEVVVDGSAGLLRSAWLTSFDGLEVDATGFGASVLRLG